MLSEIAQPSDFLFKYRKTELDFTTKGIMRWSGDHRYAQEIGHMVMGIMLGTADHGM